MSRILSIEEREMIDLFKEAIQLFITHVVPEHGLVNLRGEISTLFADEYLCPLLLMSDGVVEVAGFLLGKSDEEIWEIAKARPLEYWASVTEFNERFNEEE